MPQHTQPSGAKSIAQVLEEARSQLVRLTPQDLLTELQSQLRPLHIIDIRPAAQRNLEGPFNFHRSDEFARHYHHVHVIERNVLEWRLDPQCEARLKDVVDPLGYTTRIVVVCSEGYTSSLAAVALKELGLGEATDLVGGLKGWNEFVADDGGQWG